MDTYELEAYKNGYRVIAGVDEAGRGPLAGPVVAAAVVFGKNPPTGIGIKDSKKLSSGKRFALSGEIYKAALGVGIGIAWHDEIDEINILRASIKAMERAVAQLSVKPDYLLIDGNQPTKLDIKQAPIVKGDSLSVSIAAASIVAKNARDAIMEAYHKIYPEYNFHIHKGYPTEDHRRILRSIGPSLIHRRTFKGVKKIDG